MVLTSTPLRITELDANVSRELFLRNYLAIPYPFTTHYFALLDDGAAEVQNETHMCPINSAPGPTPGNLLASKIFD
jgi:hypothetical protein